MALYRGPIVDAHHHLWRDAATAIPWLRAPDLASLAADCGSAELRVAAGGLDLVATVWIEALAEDPLAEAVEAAAVNAPQPGVATAIVAHAPLDAPHIGHRHVLLRESLTPP